MPFREKSNQSTTSQPNVSEDVNLTESTTDEETGKEEHIVTMERTLSDEESVGRLTGADLQSDELSGTEEEKDSTTTKVEQADRESNENVSISFADQDIPHTELESTDVLSSRGLSNLDVCAQEDDMAEDAGVDGVGKENLDSEEEETAEVEEPVEVFPYSGLAGVDVCASELGGTESKTEEDQADITDAEEELEADESFYNIKSSVDSFTIAKDDSLVGISFKDEVETGQIIFGKQDSELQIEGTQREVNSEGEEIKSHHETSEIMIGKVDTNDFNLNDSDDEKGEGVKNISSSHQPTIETDDENPEDETDHTNEDEMKISEEDLQQDFEKENNPNFMEDETTHLHIGDYSEVDDEEVNDGDTENLSSLVTKEGETVEAGARDLPVEQEEAQLEDTLEEKDDTSKEKEDCVEEGVADFEIQEKSDVMCDADGTVGGHQEEERPLWSEKDNTKTSDKVKFDASSQSRMYE